MEWSCKCGWEGFKPLVKIVGRQRTFVCPSCRSSAGLLHDSQCAPIPPTRGTQLIICPHCFAEMHYENWWAEFVEREGGGRQQCDACGKWFDVTCKIKRLWTSKISEEQREG